MSDDATTRVHTAYRQLLGKYALPPGIAFELHANVQLGCVRRKELPLGFLANDEYLKDVFGDGGVDGVALDRSRVCQHKDRPRAPIEAADAREFSYVVRRMRDDDPLYAHTQFVYCVSARTHVRPGAMTLFREEGVEIEVLAPPPVPTDAPILATDMEVDMEMDNALPAGSGARRVAHFADEAKFTASQRAALEAAKAFVASERKEWALQAAGGWGKSSLLRAIILNCFVANPVLVLANTTDLVSQLCDALSGLASVTVMTYQALVAKVKAGEACAYDAIFCDEAHHVENDNKWRSSVVECLRDESEAGGEDGGESEAGGENGGESEAGGENGGESEAGGENGGESEGEDISPALAGAKKVFHLSALFATRVPDVVVSYEEALAEGRIVDYAVHAVRLRRPDDEARPLEVAAWLGEQRKSLDIFLGQLTLVDVGARDCGQL